MSAAIQRKVFAPEFRQAASRYSRLIKGKADVSFLGFKLSLEPSKRYQVYGIDYGCYVDLINTAKAPQGLLDLGTAEPEIADVVPKTDFRSIRPCILNLPDFYEGAKA
ncbi:hypothetical protein [Cupriavidus necator]